MILMQPPPHSPLSQLLVLLLVCGSMNFFCVFAHSHDSNFHGHHHPQQYHHHHHHQKIVPNIVVVGSVNIDTFLSVDRLPVEGENLTTNSEPVSDVPGGKGCTQAVAVSKLGAASTLVAQLGHDTPTSVYEALTEVDTSHCRQHPQLQSGRGYVVISSTTGQVSAVVSGGTNVAGWDDWEWSNNDIVQANIDAILKNGCQCVLLQREIPEFVNRIIAKACQQRNITVIQDIGGEDRPMDREMMELCDYIVPNESELRRLVRSFISIESNENSNKAEEDTIESNIAAIVKLAKILQQYGAKNVLVTQGSRGSTLVCESGQVLYQPAHPVLHVVDETGAGDCYRAAFAVALHEGSKTLQGCLEFASAAGSCSVTKHGAVPSTPTREQVEQCIERQKLYNTQHQQSAAPQDTVLNIPRGDGLRGGCSSIHNNKISNKQNRNTDKFPFLIGSRLNSMKDRPDLWDAPLESPKDFLQRQATIPGLTCVDFNYPQHFHTWSSHEAKTALDEAGLVAGAVCLRYPSKFARGAMNHPDHELRQEAIQLTKEAAQVAIDLGCKEVVIWSAYDGYDYPFQVDYDDKWNELITAFQECCDAYPSIKFSVEYKPTDENTRFFTVPSTGAAIVCAMTVDRPNFGLTLDVGHMLMSGENPAQSIAMVGRTGKLFGIQLNDGFTRLAAEDGLMFGSVHPGMALEIMYQLRRIQFDGHFYFDTFPQRTDPLRELDYNIRRVKALWKAANAIDTTKLRYIAQHHDAVSALEMVDEALRKLDYN